MTIEKICTPIASPCASPVDGIIASGGGGTYTIDAAGDDGGCRKIASVMMGSASSPTTYNTHQNAGTITAGAVYDSDEMEYTWYKAYFRFVNVEVAQGATIASAEFKPFVAGGTGTQTFTLAGRDHDDAPAPSGTGDGAHSTHTSATVSWANPSTSAGQVTSPDVKTIIQEIVNRSGWSSGSDLMIVMWLASISTGNDGYRTFSDYTASSGTKKAQLVITVSED